MSIRHLRSRTVAVWSQEHQDSHSGLGFQELGFRVSERRGLDEASMACGFAIVSSPPPPPKHPWPKVR